MLRAAQEGVTVVRTPGRRVGWRIGRAQCSADKQRVKAHSTTRASLSQGCVDPHVLGLRPAP